MRFFAFLLLPFLAVSLQGNEKYDLVLLNGRLLDGSGNPWIYADIAIEGDRIAAIGNLAGVSANRVIDASGLYIAPGFIDTHSHGAAGLGNAKRAAAENLLKQGVTTILVNPDGGGATDLVEQAESFENHGTGVNFGQLVPHGSVRAKIMGHEDRHATESEMDQMRELVRKGMEAGAFGLSSGPFYAPGSFAPTSELIELSKISSEFGGVYQSHIRDESDYSIGVVKAVDEVIEIAENADLPGIVTHIKVLGPRVWGYSAALVHRIERARARGVEVFADQYPYNASQTSLSAGLVPRWALDGGRKSFLQRMKNPEDRVRIRADMIDNLDRRGGGARILISSFSQEPELAGRYLSEIAEERGKSEIDTAMELLELGTPRMISFNMHDSDVELLMRQPWTMTASDGYIPAMNSNSVPHPRSYGTFPRKIRKYVQEDGVIDLAAAIRSMTHLPAAVYKIHDRGILRPGAFADIVVFDLEKVNDTSTFADPEQLAEGMVYVFVNGQVALDDGEVSGERHGRRLKR